MAGPAGWLVDRCESLPELAAWRGRSGHDAWLFRNRIFPIESKILASHVPGAKRPSGGLLAQRQPLADGFFREAFVDEIAEASRTDPLNFRRRLLAGNPRALAVLDDCATRANWGERRRDGTRE